MHPSRTGGNPAFSTGHFINGNYFETLNMQNGFKEVFKEVGLNNTSSLLLMLFLLLNSVDELIKKGENIDLTPINQKIKFYLISLKCNDKMLDLSIFDKEINYIQCIRNSVAHFNTEFHNNFNQTAALFKSYYDSKKKYFNIEFEMYTKDVGSIIDLLFDLIVTHLNKKHRFDNKQIGGKN